VHELDTSCLASLLDKLYLVSPLSPPTSKRCPLRGYLIELPQPPNERLRRVFSVEAQMAYASAPTETDGIGRWSSLAMIAPANYESSIHKIAQLA